MSICRTLQETAAPSQCLRRRRQRSHGSSYARRRRVLIGGDGGERKTLRIVARHADIWSGFGPPGQIAHRPEVLRGWCDTEHRDFDEIEVSVGVQRADRHVDMADEYHSLGVRRFTFGIDGRDYDLSPILPWLARRDAMKS